MTNAGVQATSRGSTRAGRFNWPDGLMTQELVVTLLGAYVAPRRRRVWSGGLVRLLGDFGFSPGAARVALGRLVRRELLARVRDGRLVYYELVGRTEHLLTEGDRRIFSFGRSQPTEAEVWTIVWHSVPDDQRLERARLARRLRFLGFGQMQDALWVSPHDRQVEVGGLLRELGVERHAVVILGRPPESLSFPALILGAWDRDDLVNRYTAFVSEFAPYREQAEDLTDREAFLVRTRLVHLFRDFPFLDPELPSDVMPETHLRAHAVEIFHEVYDRLSGPAFRYFNQMTTPLRPRRRAGAR